MTRFLRRQMLYLGTLLTSASYGEYTINYANVDTSSWNCVLCEFDRLDRRNSVVSLNSGVSLRGEPHFGRVSGIDEKGGFQSVDFSVDLTSSGNTDVVAVGTNLGMRPTSMKLTGNHKRQFGFEIQSRVRVHNLDREALTPFRTTENQLWLEPSWQPGYSTTDFLALDDLNRPIYLQHERTELSTSAWYQLNRHWRTSVMYREDTKVGTTQAWRDDLLQSTALPQPIDQTTTTLQGSVEYGAEKLVSSLALGRSQFRSQHDTLKWDSPYAESDALRRSASDPSHITKFVRIGVGYRTRNSSSFHVEATRSTTVQTGSGFLPYSTNLVLDSEPPLLHSDLALETAQLAIAYLNPIAKNYQIEATYEVGKRTSLRPVVFLEPVLGDLFVPSQVMLTAYNLSRDTAALRVLGTPRESVRIDFGLEQKSTTRTNQEILENTALKAWTAVDVRLAPSRKIKTQLTVEDKGASVFTHSSANHPWTRRFHYAPRESWAWKNSLDVARNAAWSIAMSIDYEETTFPQSQLGRQSLNRFNGYLNISYAKPSRRDLSVFLGNQRWRLGTSGTNWTSDGSWHYDTEDLARTATVRYKEDKLFGGPLRVELDLSLVGGTTAIATQYRDRFEEFPEVVSDLSRLGLKLDYLRFAQTTVSLQYLIQQYKQVDWSIDGLEQTSIRNALSMNRHSPDYTNHVTALTIEKVL